MSLYGKHTVSPESLYPILISDDQPDGRFHYGRVVVIKSSFLLGSLPAPRLNNWVGKYIKLDTVKFDGKYS